MAFVPAAFDASHPASGLGQGAPLQVLVIDDQAAVREGLSRLIAAAPGSGPRQVHTAGSPVEALRLLHEARVTLVVLDVDLAGADGLALLPALCARARVLVLTSHGDTATRARALRLGAEAFVEKSEPAAVLLAHLARLSPARTGGDKPPMPAGQSSPAAAGASSLAGRAPPP